MFTVNPDYAASLLGKALLLLSIILIKLQEKDTKKGKNPEYVLPRFNIYFGTYLTKKYVLVFI